MSGVDGRIVLVKSLWGDLTEIRPKLWAPQEVVLETTVVCQSKTAGFTTQWTDSLGRAWRRIPAVSEVPEHWELLPEGDPTGHWGAVKDNWVYRVGDRQVTSDVLAALSTVATTPFTEQSGHPKGVMPAGVYCVKNTYYATVNGRTEVLGPAVLALPLILDMLGMPTNPST